LTPYLVALTQAMTELGQRENTIFLGQAVSFPGTGMTQTFAEVPEDKKLELPVAEEMQLGMSIGLSLAGYLPISVYPRINFLLLAMGQLVLHLDALPIYGNGWRPKVIIRTMIATANPLDPGPQHLGNYTHTIAQMLRNVQVVDIFNVDEIVPAYRYAAEAKHSVILVEYADRHHA
jgi:pyruvate/2-oxoglutarate/acetoin dehydrogenase E1 component